MSVDKLTSVSSMAIMNLSTRPLRLAQLQNPKLNFTFIPHFSLRNSRIYGVYRDKGQNFSFTLSCKLNTTRKKQGAKENSAPSKIRVPESDGAPTLLDAGDAGNGASPTGPPPAKKSKAGGLGLLRRLPKRVVASLSSLTLAISEMFALAGLMAIGSIIEQGEAPDFYFQKFPEDHPLFGFFNWRWVLTLGFDHMFSSPIFLGTSALLAASLMACTYTTQIPLVKVARRWSFLHSAQAIRKQEYSDTLPKASIQDLGAVLMGAGYEVFLKGSALYAFKGLAGRIAPIGVHVALLLIMFGGTISATGSFRGSVNVPQGLNFVIGDVLGPTGFLSTPSEAFSTEVHVNRFYMEYYESGEVSQFRSDLSLYDLDGKEVMRKTISVNDPLRYGGITIYQTDWSFSALQIMKDDEGPFNLAMAPLKINGDKKLFGTFLPIGDTDSPDVKGISMLARDLQSIILYDKEGKFVGVRRPNSKLPIEIDGTKILIVDAIGSTGLDLKSDPGVPIVYAGFGALMLTTCISFLSHSQIWALQDGTMVVVGGKTNRAKGEFPDAISSLLDQVPEIVESSPSKESNGLSL
ncbi:PREDICTED: cytochrome c biogenesis protein CCS1, chloroplastic-like [Ipomoea nil]|uniref:cytochrome c biogenesis protein CCS1, chloroplastic-like n=1 Tax=Ipomoea nil TaxID=35883 RepID=UPI000900D036|nr:PREDICTED: cytochrome c biogenesis protein CCS1, chloroplastic-like [Ipomoea nil]XP_019166218.1 PREDICTED: cytochrome c biogenesis protein CCS1, chloroplastic-like [Ipomoea nil]